MILYLKNFYLIYLPKRIFLMLNVAYLQNTLLDHNVYPHGKVCSHQVHAAKSGMGDEYKHAIACLYDV